METGLLIRIDGSAQARSDASALRGDLDKLKLSGESTVGAFDRLTKQYSSVDAASKLLSASTKAGSVSSDTFAQSVVRQEAALNRLVAQLSTSAAAAQRSTAGLVTHAAESQAASHAMDLFSGATTRAKTELLVLAHELSQGNTRRFGGSLLVLAEEVGASGIIFSATTGVIAALLAPVALIGVAAIRSAQDTAAFNTAIQLSGNFAGVTRQQYEAMATGVASATNGKIAAARGVLNDLIRTGQFASGALGPVARAITDIADASGEDVGKVTADFERMSGGVAKWAAEANGAYHFLTGAQYQYIADLERQGQTEKAEKEVAKLLYTQIEAGKEPLTGLSAAWHDLNTEITSSFDILKKLVAIDIRSELADLGRLLDIFGHGGPQAAFGASQFMAQPSAQASVAAAAAEKTAAAAQRNALEVAARQAVSQSTDALNQQITTYGKGQVAIEQYAKSLDLAKAASIGDAAERQRYIADIDAIYAPAIKAAAAVDRLTNANEAQAQAIRDQEAARKNIEQHANALDQFNSSLDAIIEKSGSNGNSALDKYLSQMEQIDRIRRQASKSDLADVETQRKLTEATKSAGDAFQYQSEKFRDAFDNDTNKLIVGNTIDPYLLKIAQATAEFKRAAEEAKRALDNKSITQPEYDSRIGALGQQRDLQTQNAQLGNSFAGHATGITDVQKLQQALNPLKTSANQVGDVLHQAFSRANDDLADMVSHMVLFGNRGQISGKQIEQSLIQGVVGGLIKVGLQMAENFALGEALKAAGLVTSVSTSAATAAAAAPAAAATSIYSFGGAALAGGAALIATLALSKTLFSASQGFDVPAGVNPLTQLHEQEMVLPASLANPMRSLLAGGGSKGITVQVTNNHSGADVAVGNVLTQADGSLILEMAVNRARADMLGRLGNAGSPENAAIRNVHGTGSPRGSR